MTGTRSRTDAADAHRPAIEMVLPSMPTAGMEVLVARMVRALDRRGHRVGVTCIETLGPLGEELADEGVRVTLAGAHGLRTIVRAPDLEHWLHRAGADVVHVHSGAWLKASGAARRVALPVVATVHGIEAPEPWYGPGLMHWAARRSDRVVAVSDSVADHLLRTVRVAPERLTTIPNGIDTERFAPAGRTGAIRRRLGLSPATRVIGHVARLNPIKNQALLVAAFGQLHARMPDTALVIVGDGPLRRDLEERVASLGLTGAVHFIGLERDVAPIYADFDAFVLSSHSEGTSMSMLEAMASGIACVATAVGGNPALLADGRCGMLVPAGDPESLANALHDLIGDDVRRGRLAEAARARVLAHFSECAMLDAYVALYRRLRPERAGRAQDREAPCAV